MCAGPHCCAVRIFRTKRANADLDGLAHYYGLRNLAAAVRLLDAIDEAEQHLRGFPETGRRGRIEGTREWVVVGTPFLIVYRIRENSLRVLRVLHHAQQWPPAS